MSKETIIDGISTIVDHCNSHTPCPHNKGVSFCEHPIFDKGQDREGDILYVSTQLEDSLPYNCPLKEKSI